MMARVNEHPGFLLAVPHHKGTTVRPTFDPRDHIRQLEDGREYLDLKWRIVWLRSQEPDASIESQIVATSEDEVVCRSTISLRSGASVTAHGSAQRSENDQPVEAAENRATMRALASLGYGAEYADDDDVAIPRSFDPPVNLMTARTLLENSHEPLPDEDDETPTTDDAGHETRESDSESTPGRERTPDRRAERTSAYETSSTRPQPATPASSSPQEAEDISWTKFWAWAKPRGYGSAVELGDLLNVDVLSHTPGEIRRMIKRYELEHPPGGATD
jgi:hypothetical protein